MFRFRIAERQPEVPFHPVDHLSSNYLVRSERIGNDHASLGQFFVSSKDLVLRGVGHCCSDNSSQVSNDHMRAKETIFVRTLSVFVSS